MAVKNSLSKMHMEKNEYLAANKLQEGQLESGLTQRVFTLPKHLAEIVKQTSEVKNFRKCLDGFYKMSRYLNDDQEEVAIQ